MFLPTGQLLQPTQIPTTHHVKATSRVFQQDGRRGTGCPGERGQFVFVCREGGGDLKDSENSARGLGSNKGWQDRNTHSG